MSEVPREDDAERSDRADEDEGVTDSSRVRRTGRRASRPGPAEPHVDLADPDPHARERDENDARLRRDQPPHW